MLQHVSLFFDVMKLNNLLVALLIIDCVKYIFVEVLFSSSHLLKQNIDIIGQEVAYGLKLETQGGPHQVRHDTGEGDIATG